MSLAYSRELVEVYDRRHFGGAAGRLIFDRDCSTVLALLPPPPGLILDIPCGTGVYSGALAEQGYALLAADASAPMLELAGPARSAGLCVRCDVNHLPFKDAALDATVTLRLFSHFPAGSLPPMLFELKRVVKPGGRLVFDTFRWTPRHLLVLRRFVDRGQICVVSPAEVQDMIRNAGLRVVDSRALHLFSPIWQRKLPLWLLKALVRLEQALPDRWLLRTMWACIRD
jgi:SAM-dependent methyltransferase